MNTRQKKREERIARAEGGTSVAEQPVVPVIEEENVVPVIGEEKVEEEKKVVKKTKKSKKKADPIVEDVITDPTE
jgi:RAB protein geranylgeranyltransferase component A